LFSTTALALAEGGENIIQPNGSLFVVLILFIIFVFVLNRLLFKPVGRVLDEREALTVGATAEARAATRQYQARLADYEASIRQARADGYRQSEHRRAAALEQRQHLIEEAKQQAAAEIESARSEVARETAEARAALEREARQIAEHISRTVLGRAVGGGAD
jgi:F-type H+-transporting ATPase subunit b